MDIYRYFHPHHNPRLFSTPVRQQELSELEQAAGELKKALERARLRVERAPAGRILPSHFIDLLKAARFIESSLQTLCDAHEGDEPAVLRELVQERTGLRGWEAWSSIVREQLASEEYAERAPLITVSTDGTSKENTTVVTLVPESATSEETHTEGALRTA